MYSVGIDVGTTSCKLNIRSSAGVIFSEQLPHEAHIPRLDKPEFDEQSAKRIVDTVETLFARSGYAKDSSKMKSIQLCGQMHGFILWSSEDPQSIVSSLVTWQDQRCSTDFLNELDSTMKHLRTGYGLATLLWMMKNQGEGVDALEKYDRAGTIADYIAAILCQKTLREPMMSTQMATSWGATDTKWPFVHRLLPNIVPPGTIVGYWKTNVPVYVGLGDLQCSVFSCQPKEQQGIVNISTSAQLALIIDRSSVR
jgi:sedoheptulokinase